MWQILFPLVPHSLPICSITFGKPSFQSLLFKENKGLLSLNTCMFIECSKIDVSPLKTSSEVLLCEGTGWAIKVVFLLPLLLLSGDNFRQTPCCDPEPYLSLIKTPLSIPSPPALHLILISPPWLHPGNLICSVSAMNLIIVPWMMPPSFLRVNFQTPKCSVRIFCHRQYSRPLLIYTLTPEFIQIILFCWPISASTDAPSIVCLCRCPSRCICPLH